MRNRPCPFKSSGERTRSAIKDPARTRRPPPRAPGAASRDVHADGPAVLHQPLPPHHHAVGPVRAAQDKRGERVAGAGEAQLVQIVEGEVGLHADRDGTDVVAPQAARPNLRSPSAGRQNG